MPLTPPRRQPPSESVRRANGRGHTPGWRELVAATVVLAVAFLAGAEDLQLNVGTTAGDQIAPRVRHLGGMGGELAVWESNEFVTKNLRGAKVEFSLSGPPVRTEFDVALDVPDGIVWYDVVGFDSNGTFAVVWEAGDGTVNAQCFNRDTLQPLGGSVQLGANGVGEGGAVLQQSSALPTVEVSWMGSDGNGGQDRYRMEMGFNCAVVTPATAGPLGFTCEQDPAVATNGTVTLTACRSPETAALARGIASSDIRVAVETQSTISDFVVNTYTTSSQLQPAMAAGPGGEFVVAWSSFGSPGDDTSSLSIQARRLDSTGTPVGSQFQVNTGTSFYQLSPSVAFEPGGGFVVAWTSFSSTGTDQDQGSIQARHFPANEPAQDDVQVNSYTTSIQESPDLAVVEDGTVFIAWNSAGSAGTDTDGYSIQGKLFELGLLFRDGFESAGTSGWSATGP